MGAVFEARVLANLFVIFVAGKVHAKNGVVVIGAGKFCGGISNELFNQQIDVNPARLDHFHSDALGNITRFNDRDVLVWHVNSLLLVF